MSFEFCSNNILHCKRKTNLPYEDFPMKSEEETAESAFRSNHGKNSWQLAEN